MKAIKDTSALYTFVQWIRPYQGWIWLSVLFSIIVGIIDVSLAILSKNVLDTAFEKEVDQVVPLVYAMLIAITAGVACKFLIKLSSIHFSAYVIRDIRARLFQKFVKMPISVVESKHSGNLGSHVNNDTAVIENVLENKFYEYIYYPLVFVCAFIYLFHINWQLLLFSVILIPTSSFLIGRLARPIDRMTADIQSRFGQINSSVQETVGGIAVVKAYNLQNIFINRFRSVLHHLFQQSMKIERRKAWMEPVNTLQMWGTYFLCTIISAYMAAVGAISVGELLVFLVLINQVINPISALPQLISNFKMVLAATERIEGVLSQEQERTGGTVYTNLRNEVAIQLKQVSFSYGAGKKVLDRVDLTLEKGKTLAIVGPSGAGKSSVFNLICGLYELSSGSIEMWGRDMRELDIAFIRSQISIVSQDTFLFPASIMDNLKYARSDATQEELIEASKAAHAHEFIMSLPQGYDTFLEERGSNLSGGQKQRLSIARAFLKNAPILLLDEPTSALDAHSEESIQTALRDICRDRSTIIIAHRLSTIKDADEIIVMDQGRIIERGTHEVMVNRAGIYRDLYAATRPSMGRGI
ncbi:ABC transporter ATP-binding protein [Xylanibacillus composti]|uniref:ABC transporter ATP-binding protein n=1 Tax=Xylanibacillus composti TaxID=1572762 RepID=A0A8J4H929_9BACL|nr:ABC transporter ATP-binding protein [Xylanibacillus composti]MDT9727185.1 ABC transporter ATP-binding protein [Xylanibacillus composti]GIQ71484.1 ABC transporter ATP-binding protein [Xylanibacillus composti]